MSVRAALALTLVLGCQVDSGGDGAPDRGVDGTPRGIDDAGAGDVGGGGGSGGCDADELCNGEDDDCDGRADEGFGLGAPCTAGTGICATDGTFVCGPDGAAVCSSEPGAAGVEVCDGRLDEDCDGQVDEGFDLGGDPENCGACGEVCAYDHALPGCEAGRCFMSYCDAGFEDANGDVSDGCECPLANGGVEACNGVDDDCDDEIDEDFDVGAACSAGGGACLRGGEQVCAEDGAGVVCDAVPGEPGPEACNGEDDDCDGEADEDFDADGDGSPACECAGEGCPVQDCDDDDPEVGPFARDVCGDGIDQNCDDRDAPCEAPAGRVTSLAVDGGGGAGCRDLDGDGEPDNALAVASIIVNDQLEFAIDDRQLNLILLTMGLTPPTDTGRFDLAVVVGVPRVGPDYDLSDASVDEDGDPLVVLPDAVADMGAMVAGPGDFPFEAPFNGVQIRFNVIDALLAGDLDVQAPGVTLRNGWLTGAVRDDELRPFFALLPPEFVVIADALLNVDLDTDGDGELDAYSTCLRIGATPVTLHGFPP